MLACLNEIPIAKESQKKERKKDWDCVSYFNILQFVTNAPNGNAMALYSKPLKAGIGNAPGVEI